MAIGDVRAEVQRFYAESRKALMQSIEGLAEEQFLEPSLDGWSVKDNLLHVAQWDEMRAIEIRRISAGRSSAYRGMDHNRVQMFNELSSTLRRDLPLSQAFWELEFTRARVLEAVAELTEEGADTARYTSIGLTSGHEREHAETITRWRSAKGW